MRALKYSKQPRGERETLSFTFSIRLEPDEVLVMSCVLFESGRDGFRKGSTREGIIRKLVGKSRRIAQHRRTLILTRLSPGQFSLALCQVQDKRAP